MACRETCWYLLFFLFFFLTLGGCKESKKDQFCGKNLSFKEEIRFVLTLFLVIRKVDLHQKNNQISEISEITGTHHNFIQTISRSNLEPKKSYPKMSFVTQSFKNIFPNDHPHISFIRHDSKKAKI